MERGGSSICSYEKIIERLWVTSEIKAIMTQSRAPLRWSVIGHIYNKSLQNDGAEKPSSLSSAQWHRRVELLWRQGFRAERP